MTRAQQSRLVLGGHTFISQLGNEPQPDSETQVRIVEACLDHGVTRFDTTHRPERVALGRALKTLGRRDEAVIIAWNFFEDVGDGQDDKLDRPGPYEPARIEAMLEELQTDRIDYLMVHELDGDVSTPEIETAQEQVAVEYRDKGVVEKLGVWEPGAGAAEKYGRKNPYDFMMAPFNVAVAEKNEPQFRAAKELGWETICVSPFIRGWELDKMVDAAANLHPDEEPDALRSRLADLMLRFSLSSPYVDYVTTAMRRPEWVAINVASAGHGPLSESETKWLEGVRREVAR